MRAIVYCDLTYNRVIIEEIDEKELEEEFEGDISAYAEAFAPSNTCDWMEINDKTQFIADADVLKRLLKMIEE